jgi:hypothetical protein
MYPATEMVSPLLLDEFKMLTSTLSFSKFWFVTLTLIHFPGPELRHKRNLNTNMWKESKGVIFGARHRRMFFGFSSRDGMGGVVDLLVHGYRMASDMVSRI